MVKADIVSRVHDALLEFERQQEPRSDKDGTAISKATVIEAVESVFAGLSDAMVRGERIEFRGFGVFQVKPRKRGIGRNPRTGLEVKIPPGRTVRFKPGKDLRNLEA